MTKNKASGNILSIQLLRGIAAFMVVLSHSVASTLYLPEDNIVRKFFSYGWSGVEIFFIISGFIIPYSMYRNQYRVSEFGSLMVRRIARIEPPYIISIVLFLILNYFIYFTPLYSGSETPAPMDWGNVLGHIGYINAFTGKQWLSPVYWTLAIEFEYYILIGIIFQLVVSTNKIIRRITHTALLIIAASSMAIFAEPSSAPIYNGHLFTFLPYFLMGIALFQYRCTIIERNEFLLLITTNLLLCLFFDTTNGLLLTCISFVSLVLIQHIQKVPRFFLFLGTVSYSLYLTHTLVINRIIVLSGKLSDNRYIEARLVLCLAICVLTAWIYYLIAEKPFTTLSKKIKYATSKNKLKPDSTATINSESER